MASVLKYAKNNLFSVFRHLYVHLYTAHFTKHTVMVIFCTYIFPLERKIMYIKVQKCLFFTSAALNLFWHN